MKTRVLISIMLMSLLGSACSDSFSETYCEQYFGTDFPLTKSAMSDAQVDAYRLVEDGYIEMVDYQYRIKINESEACELGYSVLGYRELQNSLDESNKMLDSLISSYENDPTIFSYTITDCTYDNLSVEPQIEIPSLRTSNEGIHTAESSGEFDPSDSTPQTATFFAPNGMTNVTGVCYCKRDPFGLNILSTRANGIVRSGTCTRAGTINVAIATSNTLVSVTYQTTDDAGGNCKWEGRYN